MIRSPIHTPYEIIPYCATCDQEWPPDTQKRLGTRFVCPDDVHENRRHTAAIVKGRPGKFWLRIEAAILRYEFFTLALFRTKVFSNPAPMAMIVRALLILGAFALSAGGSVEKALSFLIGLFVILDITLNLTSIAFISRYPAHPLRTVIQSITSIFTITLGYAVLYRSIGEFNRAIDTIDAIYFSVITLATIGYGDIVPMAGFTKLLVVSEVFFGIYFLTVLLSTQASWINTPPNIKEPDTFATLFPSKTE